MIIIVSLSSVSAYDSANTPVSAGEDIGTDELIIGNEFGEIDPSEDFEDDEDLDYEDNFDDDDNDYEDDEDDGDIDYDDEDNDEDFDDEDDEEDDEDFDYDDEDYEDDFDDEDEDYYEEISSFDYYQDRILKYLQKFGNASEDWYMQEDFNNTYKSYLEDNSSYGLDEENENYETHLKIYDSIISTLERSDLEDNETNYFKFLVMYYLNNYANTTNYTWNDEDSFEEFLGEMDSDMLTAMAFSGSSKQAFGHFNPIKKISPFKHNSYLNIIRAANSNETDADDDDNISIEDNEKQEDSWLDYIINLLKMLFIKFLIFIKTEFNIGF